jgi:peptidoglycan/LPS O-acetylase OafA/YrhL
LYIVRYVVGDGYAEAKYKAGEWTWGYVALSFAVYFVLSIILGIVLSMLIEKPFLAIRDKYFPRRQFSATETVQLSAGQVQPSSIVS